MTAAVNRDLERLVIENTVKAVNSLPEPWKEAETGRPPHEARNVAVLCVLKAAFNRTYEGIEAYAKASSLLKELLGKQLPTQSVIRRGMKRLPKQCLKRLNRKLTARFRRKGLTVAAGSTGMKLRTSSGWYDIRIKKKGSRKDFEKLHVAGCIETGIIHSFAVTAGRCHDSPQLKELLGVFRKLLKVAGDSGYLSRRNCILVREKGGKPFFRLKCNVTSRAKNSPAWKAMLRLYFTDKDSWLKEYHVRSFVEAIFASIKRRFGNFLRSVLKCMQEKELSLKVVSCNMVRILYAEASKALGLPLWVKA